MINIIATMIMSDKYAEHRDLDEVLLDATNLDYYKKINAENDKLSWKWVLLLELPGKVWVISDPDNETMHADMDDLIEHYKTFGYRVITDKSPMTEDMEVSRSVLMMKEKEVKNESIN